MTASLPFIETNLNLTPEQISMFTNGLKYIIPCQSRFSRQSKKKTIKTAYETVLATVKTCLDHNHMSITDQRAKQAFPELERIIHDLHRKPLSRRLYRRARREHKQVKRLQNFLRSRPDIIICQVDKNPTFYIGDAATMELKAYEYMHSTKAYQEITDGHSPLADSLCAVQTLLQNLLQQKTISKELYNKLYPKMNKLELAHFHGLPKIHKVMCFFFSQYRHISIISFHLFSLIYHYDQLLPVFMHQQY
jgi:hypothetical protein